RLVIAFADHEVVSDDTAKRGEWQEDSFARFSYRRANNNAQLVLFDCQMQVEGAVASRSRREMVLLQQVEYRNGSLLFDVRVTADHAVLVECYASDAPLICGIAPRLGHGREFTP